MGRPANLQIRVTSDSTQATQDIAQAESRITSTLNGLKQAGPALAAAAGLAIGAGIMAGIGKALDQGRIKGRLAAQLGVTGPEAEKAGRLAGSLFSKGITEDFQSAADAVSATMRSGIAPPGATAKQLESLATKAQDLAGTFDQETSQITRAVSTMLRTGIAKNADEAFDVLTKGFQNGTNAADDLLDTFSEYSTQFRDLGLNASQSLGLMSQILKAGGRDADTAADALKELNIIIQAKGAPEALKTLGLNAQEMANAFATGGPAAALALDQILDRLRLVKDPAERSALAVELLGTKSEDLSKALLAMDPSTAVEGLGQLAGSADQVGISLRDNAGAEVTAFKNTLETKLVNFLGGTVIPSLKELKRWVSEEVTPAFKNWATTANGDVNPALQGITGSANSLSGSLQNQDGRWDALYKTLRNNVAPVMRDVALIMANNLASGARIAATFIIDLVDGVRQLVGWLISAGRWLAELASKFSIVRSVQNFVGGISSMGFSGASFAQAQQVTQNDSLARTAAAQVFATPSQVLMRETFYRPSTVNVTIDGQQLQGRITRTVSSALQYDGARYTAGGWA